MRPRLLGADGADATAKDRLLFTIYRPETISSAPGSMFCGYSDFSWNRADRGPLLRLEAASLALESHICFVL